VIVYQYHKSLQKFAKTHISCEIFLLAQDCLVTVELSIETYDTLGSKLFIGFHPEPGLYNLLMNDFGGELIKVANLD